MLKLFPFQFVFYVFRSHILLLFIYIECLRFDFGTHDD